MGRARSRAEQNQIVLGWRRSGQAARAYGSRVGVSAASLHRWSSLLNGREASEAGTLVEVVPSDAGTSEWAWEIEFAAGTLRVRGALEPPTAKAIIGALRRAGRR